MAAKKQPPVAPNLELWNRVFNTDPEYLKEVSKGGYKFHAIDAYGQFQKATEVFGPFGIGWGVEPGSEKFDHFTVGNAYKLFYYSATLWYDLSGQRGAFPIASSIQIDSQTSAGKYRVDEDFMKKVRTDALTKGLSMLGFNADVFLGMWDGNKYVGEVQTPASAPISTSPFIQPQPTQPAPSPYQQPPQPEASPYQRSSMAIAACQTKAELDNVARTIGDAMKAGMYTQDESNALTSEYHAASTRISA